MCELSEVKGHHYREKSMNGNMWDSVNENTILLLRKVDILKRLIDARRPLSEVEAKQLQDFFRVETTYTSNAIEGNGLTLSETKVFLEDGLTVGGKAIKDYYEAEGHAEAYDYMYDLAIEGESFELTEAVIRNLHQLFYRRIEPDKAGRYRDGQVFITGTAYVPPPPNMVPELMQDYIRVFERKRDSGMHPVLLAAFAHRRLVDIHPFIDGNGRTARLVMNLIVINSGLIPLSIPPVRRLEYYNSLILAQKETGASDEAFNELIVDCEFETMKDYCRMLGISYREALDRSEERPADHVIAARPDGNI
jgi:Fic family protein